MVDTPQLVLLADLVVVVLLILEQVVLRRIQQQIQVLLNMEILVAPQLIKQHLEDINLPEVVVQVVPVATPPPHLMLEQVVLVE